MKISKTPFAGLLVLEPDVFDDERGNFYEAYNKQFWSGLGINNDFIQDNQSRSVKNVIRGLHFQAPPHAQTKLVRVLHGTILDVAVDLRKDQPTFKQLFVFELSSDNKTQLLIPKGFAHGFSVLSEYAEVLYKCDEYFYPALGGGIRFDDPELGIDWKVNLHSAIISKKDRELPLLSETTLQF